MLSLFGVESAARLDVASLVDSIKDKYTSEQLLYLVDKLRASPVRHHFRPIESSLDVDVIEIFEVSLFGIERADSETHCLDNPANQGTHARLERVVFCIFVIWIERVAKAKSSVVLVAESDAEVECMTVDLYTRIGKRRKHHPVALGRTLHGCTCKVSSLVSS